MGSGFLERGPPWLTHLHLDCKKSSFAVAPKANLVIRYDSPDAAVSTRMFAIRSRGNGVPGRMGVVIAQDARSARTFGLVGSKQYGRVDFEPRLRLIRDVGCRPHLVDQFATSQQHSAAFMGSRAHCLFTQARQNASCHFHNHPQILLAMGASGNSNDNVIEGRIGTAGGRLDKALAEASGLSRERVKALLSEGRVTLADKTVSQASVKVAEGTPFSIMVPAAVPAEAIAQEIPLVVVFEDEDLIVIDKPAGLVVHPAAGNFDGTLVNALLHHCRGQLSGIGGVARPGIVHRIDKDTSGLLVVAKTDRAHEGLAAQFADHSIERSYRAIVSGYPVPPAGTITGAIARSPHNRKKMAIVPKEEEGRRGKHAVTHYHTLERLSGASLIECRLETGRTHQVRVHMSSIGHALLGDPVYGRTPSALRPLLQRLQFSRQALHAAELGFVHPVKKEKVHFASQIPADMTELIGDLRN